MRLQNKAALVTGAARGIAAMADRVVTMRSGEIVQVHRNATRAIPAELHW